MAMWILHVAWNEHVLLVYVRVQELSSYHFQTRRNFVRNDFTSGLLLSFYTAAEAA